MAGNLADCKQCNRTGVSSAGSCYCFLVLGKALCTRAFYRVVFHSFIKISAGFLAALLAGLVLGSIAAVKKVCSPFWNRWCY